MRAVMKRDPLRDGYVVAAAVWTVAIAVGLVGGGVDARTFYDNLAMPYVVRDYAAGEGFYWSPVAALVLRPITILGFQPFAAALTGIGLAALYWVGGRWAWALLFFPPVWWDLSSGNVNTLLGASAALGLRYPALWAIPLLTKVTPGLGILWFAVRREWRAFVVALVATAGLVLASFVVAPTLWWDWISALTSNSVAYAGPGYFTVPIPLLPRLPLAALLVAWGALTNRRWTVPVAAWFAIPVLWWTTAAMLVAAVPLVAWVSRSSRRTSGAWPSARTSDWRSRLRRPPGSPEPVGSSER